MLTEDKKLQKIINSVILISILGVLGCAYYNTFFNAKEYYNTGEKKQKNSVSDKISSDAKTNYNNAIKKCWKLIDTYGDSSEYADDALLLIGKAHYNIEEYEQSAKVLNQFLLKYLNSDHIPEAKLWLAKNYIQLDKEKEAQEILDNIFDNKVSNDIASQAFYILGELYFKNEDYENAIDNFQKSVEITDDEEMKGDAEYKTGEAFFILGEYENAIYHFQKIEKMDVPVAKEYEAIMQKVNAMAKLKQYDQADQILRQMLANLRFSDQFSLIETKIANIAEIEGDTDYSMERYYDILKKYPKKEGAALSAFYLGQLYEFEIGNFDSAKTYYDRVSTEYTRSEAKEDAQKRSKLLNEYLTMRDQINRDKRDLYKLEHGDSLLVDSVAVEPLPGDTLQTEENEEISANENIFPSFNEQANVNVDTTLSEHEASDSLLQLPPLLPNTIKSPPKQIKKAVTRNPHEVEGSLIKNSFALAEYFLLKYQNYDSSLARYEQFVSNFSDSILTPKAYYSLYFIYSNELKDSLKADSIKTIIRDNYANTQYGKKLSGDRIIKKDVSASEKSDIFKDKFLEAENHLFNGEYEQAINLYKEISVEDSGSIWAQKSMYAIAYTYEKLIPDTALAILSYQSLALEYPSTEFGKVAKYKTAEPVAEAIETENEGPSDTTSADLENEKKISPEITETDYVPVDPSSIIDTDMLDYKRPIRIFNTGYDETGENEPEKQNNKSILKERLHKELPKNFIQDNKDRKTNAKSDSLDVLK